MVKYRHNYTIVKHIYTMVKYIYSIYFAQSYSIGKYSYSK